MDLETVEAIERLTERIESLETSLRSEFRDGLGSLRTEFRDELGSLRTEFRDELADVRRHSAMLNEATRDDIRLVAEAVAAITVKIDSMQG